MLVSKESEQHKSLRAAKCTSARHQCVVAFSRLPRFIPDVDEEHGGKQQQSAAYRSNHNARDLTLVQSRLSERRGRRGADQGGGRRGRR